MLTRSFLSSFLVFTLLVAAPSVSFAQDEQAASGGAAAQSDPSSAPAASAEDDAAASEALKEKRAALLKRVTSFTATLNEAQASHFFTVYSIYSLISTVNNVERDINNAVNKCVENNPKMKTDIMARFETWKTEVHKARDDAQANLDTLTAAQNYMTQKEVKDLYKMIDDTRVEADKRFKRIPVSTPEACEFMLTKMDESQKTMVALMHATLASYPDVLQKNQK